MTDDDPRRSHPISIVWDETRLIGRIHLGSRFWGAVEWSDKRQQWCVEDAAGQCLQHVSSIHGTATSKTAAVQLAKAIIRDGRMPDPHAAWETRSKADNERRRKAREKRDQQPSVQKRRAERQQQHKEYIGTMRAEWEAEHREKEAQPLYEMLHQVFGFADPELWRSNSFATMPPRLIIHLEAVVADLDSEPVDARQSPRTRDWELTEIEARLAKAREMNCYRGSDEQVEVRDDHQGHTKMNNHPGAKKAEAIIRANVIDMIGAANARVFDAFAGDGVMWRAIWQRAAYYVG
jgi:hypothetical protein